MRALALALLIGIAAAAQDEPLARVNTRLVEVDVVVRTKNGPVADLKETDFTVLDQGKPQKIALFAVKSQAGREASGNLLIPGAVSNRLDSDGGDATGATVVLLDRLNTAPEDQGYGIVALNQFLEKAAGTESIAIYSLNKTLRIVQDFTADHNRLMRAAGRAGMDKSTDEGAADLVADIPLTGDALTDGMTQNAIAEMTDHAMQNRVDITAYALQLIAKHLSGMPGRKKLVWITASFPATYTYNGHRNLTTQIETRVFSGQID